MFLDINSSELADSNAKNNAQDTILIDSKLRGQHRAQFLEILDKDKLTV